MAADATQLVEMPEVAEAAAAEASPRGPAPAPLPPSAVSPERSTLLGPRLLVVDDDPALVDYVATALQSTLAAFVPATTFDEVRRARDVDAAIVSLPFGSPDRCEETVATLRAVHSRLPVALLALEDGHAIRSRAVSSGADLFLAHPLDDAELRRAVARLEAMAPARLRVLQQMQMTVFPMPKKLAKGAKGGALTNRSALSSRRSREDREKNRATKDEVNKDKPKGAF